MEDYFKGGFLSIYDEWFLGGVKEKAAHAFAEVRLIGCCLLF